MLPWATDSDILGTFLHPYSNWVYENQPLALVIAIVVPLLLFSLRSAIQTRRRLRNLEDEAERARAPQRLPNETVERNRREEARYRKAHQSKQPTSRRGGPGPRFK